MSDPRSATTSREERGFSLVELLIVIVITLIVTGAIYGLLATGQNAFRREPEISDRQQQIRIAMDLIQRDIATAGMGLPEWTQVFTDGLDSLGPPNAQNVPTDFLELIGYDGACTPLQPCPGALAWESADPTSNCYTLPTTPMLMASVPGALGTGSMSIRFATSFGSGGTCPDPGGVVTVLAVPPLDFPPGALGSTGVRPIQIVRYEIVVDPNGVPSLWRSSQGGLTPAGAYVAAPGAGSDWELVATGIEDLQVDYKNGVGLPAPVLWAPIPGGVVAPNYNTIIREVKVTLTARTTGQQILQGESLSAGGVRAIRGSLTSVTTPRSALSVLATGPGVGDPQQWQ
jgi:prepilin-type N-terminal cleavage/methylation domain-containing protein